VHSADGWRAVLRPVLARRTRLSRPTFAPSPFAPSQVLAYNLGNFMRTLATPKASEPWLLTSLNEKMIKIGDRW